MARESAFGAEPEKLRELLSFGLEDSSEKEEQEQSDDSSEAKKQTAPEVTANMFMDKTSSQIGPFRIEKELGRGGAGVVYLAHDTKLDRRVAIKSLPPELANNEKFQARFQREAKLLASMNHPNIAAIHEELEEVHGQKYLVLEYVPGDTLRGKIAKGAMELKQALAIAIDIADAIAAAHAKGVIHRDIKPENIKITPDGRTKLLDFGIARMMSAASITASTLTESGHLVGTIGYMSPEQARGKSTDHRTDIWAIGCILYEMLTGHCVFSGETGTDILASILKTDPDWQELPPDMDASVRSIIERCLEKNADERYQSAEELLAELRECRQSLMALPPKVLNAKALFALLRRPKIAAVVLLILLISIAGISWSIHRSIKKKWAREEALPAITDLVREARYSEAFLLAQEAQEYIPNDLMLDRLLSEMTCSYSIKTNPPGAKITYKEYSDLDGKWNEIGYSPADFLLPLGAHRWLIKKDGCIPLEFARVGLSGDNPIEMELDLYEEANSPPGMILIDRQFGRYWIDKYEVTNEQFKKFVDAGGYQEEKYWKELEPFIKDGESLSFKDAMDYFLDKTYRPGPATWEGGTFGEGEAKYPVSGISWYEAAAYAEYADKSLPTVRHWRGATENFEFPLIIPFANFGYSGLVSVGASGAMSSLGVYDMAGNVREWCYNAEDDSESRRYILGGAWLHMSYVFNKNITESPWNRDEINGFRCAIYLDDTESLTKFFAPIKSEIFVDYNDVKPISDEEFEWYIKAHYSYESANAEELNIKEEEIDKESSLYWRKQKITYSAAYGDEQIIAYLFLPEAIDPPYQPVIIFPGADALGLDSSDRLTSLGWYNYIMKSGRAVLYPVYKGTYERNFPDNPKGWPPSENINSDLERWQHLHRDWTIQLVKDLRRSVDYLTIRPDMDMQKLTYCGNSWGARISPIMLAVENRIKFAVIFNGGFANRSELPEVYPLNFAPRVRCPVLMINGEHDSLFPLKTSQKPMVEMLRKANNDTEHKTYPGEHHNYAVLNSSVGEDVLKWMDDHLGPVD